MHNIHPALRFKASNYNTGMARFPENFAVPVQKAASLTEKRIQCGQVLLKKSE